VGVKQGVRKDEEGTRGVGGGESIESGSVVLLVMVGGQTLAGQWPELRSGGQRERSCGRDHGHWPLVDLDSGHANKKAGGQVESRCAVGAKVEESGCSEVPGGDRKRPGCVHCRGYWQGCQAGREHSERPKPVVPREAARKLVSRPGWRPRQISSGAGTKAGGAMPEALS
jgi:hypothetical protein